MYDRISGYSCNDAADLQVPCTGPEPIASISEYASPRGSGRSEHEVKAHPRNVGIFNHRITVDDKKKVPQSRDRSVLGSSPDNFGMEIKLFISVSGAAPDSKPHSHEDRSSFVSFQAGH